MTQTLSGGANPLLLIMLAHVQLQWLPGHLLLSEAGTWRSYLGEARSSSAFPQQGVCRGRAARHTHRSSCKTCVVGTPTAQL